MTEIIINSFLGALGAGILTLLVLAIKWFWKKIRADDLTIKALTHDAYYRNCHELLPKESITEDESDNHDYMWQAYKAQKLNGTGQKLHEQILQKPVVETPPADAGH